MKEFVDKLIESFLGKCVIYAENYEKALNIANELTEEYENDFCEWKVDGVYLMCQHKTELFVSCLEDEKYRYKHCPICGKKIKAVE